MANTNVVDYDVVTITGTAGNIVTLGALTARPTGARSFMGTLETAPVRARGDGTAPTASEGRLINPGDIVILDDSEIDVMNFIRTGSVSGELRGDYLNVPAMALRGG